VADWEYRSETEGDVVFFRYAGENLERAFSEVYVWDLDKTYLDTSWASLSELWRTALEKAFQKKNIPGTATLVRALAIGLGRQPRSVGVSDLFHHRKSAADGRKDRTKANLR
jgi:hypothetical protein